MTIEFNENFIKRYQMGCPRYTSYPTAVQFTEDFSAADYHRLARSVNKQPTPLSLYFHLPFCRTICYFCACNKWGTKDYSQADRYLEVLIQEMALQVALFDSKKKVRQIHWGGGTPTFLNIHQMKRLMDATKTYFQLASDAEGEYAIEVHPNSLALEDVLALRTLGFNRVSIGIQDFDPTVQRAVNRVQSTTKITEIFVACRRANFKSISVDLIYGLPFQSVTSFRKTIDKIIELSPDRISVFNYAHLPQLFKPQRRIQLADLPTPAIKLMILQQTIDQLTDAGFVHIGMDHFARSQDALALAQQAGSLHRTFHGYSTHAECDLIGMGVSAISQIGACYAQNQKDLKAYYQVIQSGKLATFRGIELTQDDRLRKNIIMQLACHLKISFDQLDQQYFKKELQQLALFQADGLVDFTPDGIHVTPKGKLLIRNICSVFDRYFNARIELSHHAKAI